MLRSLVIGVSAGAFALLSVAAAGDYSDKCVASAPDGADMAKIKETCDCLEAATAETLEARASMEAASSIENRDERFAALSPEAQEAVKACRKS